MADVEITPGDVERSARNFAVAQQELAVAWTRLQQALDGCAGMAGNDQLARKFSAKYEPGLDSVIKAFQRAVVILGGISLGLTQTANNHIKADNQSIIGKDHPPESLLSPEPILRTLMICHPMPCVGAGDSALPGPLARFWPNGHPGRLRTAAAAWRTAASAVETVAGQARASIKTLISSMGSQEGQAIEGYFGKVYSAGNPRTVLAGLHQLCIAMSGACEHYAAAIDDARGRMEDALIGLGFAIGVTTVIGVLGTIVSAGASDAAAAAADTAEAAAVLGPIAEDAAATVAAETAAALDGDLVAAVESAAETVPAIEAVEAETIQVDSAIAKELAAGEEAGAAESQSARNLIKNGQEFRGAGGRGGNNLPSQGGPPNGTLDKTDPQTGEVTNYTTYDMNGNAIKRVDLTGRDHGGVPVPHVVEYDVNVNPNGQTFVRPQKIVRPAEPWEIP